MADASLSIVRDATGRSREAENPQSPLVRFGPEKPLRLDAGIDLTPFQIAYQTYGELNAERSNAVLICHALTGDQHVANVHPVTGKPGWWETMVGPGRPIDTQRYFVISPNVVGAAIAGGSMGGMQVLQWAASYPERVFAALPIAASTRHSAQNIAFHEVGRQAVMADPDWRGGRYQLEGTNPRRGLAVARMGAHITYLSDAALHRKFGRRLQDRSNPTFSFDADFQVENYLRHQGISFVERFDANSYLYLTRAMDYFDLTADYDGVLAQAFRGARTRFCVISCPGLLRRDRDRQGARRLPAGGTRAVRHRARLPRGRRQIARA